MNFDDVILIAGKGHETYQEVQGERHHFDDVEQAMLALDTYSADKNTPDTRSESLSQSKKGAVKS